jgi:3-dehydroquinate synthase
LKEVRVTLVRQEDQSYSAMIGAGILSTALADLAELQPGRRVFVVTDANVKAAGHLDTFANGHEVASYVIDPSGEQSKNMATVMAVLDAMERERFGRDSLVVALGGGTVGDLAGFVAAIFKRGVPYAQAPTTTLAQADSAVGGKVGVDSEWSKNAYGAFKQPCRVYADVATLATMDERGYRAGLVESAKHAMIADAEYFDYLDVKMDLLLRRDRTVLAEIAARNIGIKASVVQKDPEEKGLRQILNFGHTVGHAIETASGFQLLHGEAVALGILAAAKLAEDLGIAHQSERPRMAALLAKLGMPENCPANISDEALWEIMSRDKKAVNSVPRFVLVDRIGHAYCVDDKYSIAVDASLVAKALDAIRP